LPVNFNKAADFLVEDINMRSVENPASKPSIYLYGVDTDTGRGIYFVLYDYLHFKGLDDRKYDMRSELPSLIDLPVSKIQPPFTIFKKNPGENIQTGDYLIVTPNSTKYVDRDLISSFAENYNLVLETKSPLSIPDINLKSLVKYYLAQRKKDTGVVSNENLWGSPDYYVFVKK
jgi:hypothetical protein